MIVQDILTRVQRSFGDTANIQIDQTDIIRWINDAQAEIVLQNKLLQTISTSATITGQSSYTLPTNILTLRSIKVDGINIKALSLSEAETEIPNFDNAATYPVDIPRSFWIWANQFTLYPAPSSQVSTIKLYYVRTPVDVTLLTDTPDLPTSYHNRLVEYCLQQAYELDENWAAAQAKGSQFAAGVQQTRNLTDWPEEAFYPSITSTDTSFDYIYGY